MKIEWKLSDEQMNEYLAHKPGVRGAVRRTAREKAAIARGYLMAHRREGDASIEVTTGEVDAFVSLVDAGEAAAAIEYGNKYGGGIEGGVLRKAFGL